MIHPETGEVLDSREDFISAMREQEERIQVVYRTLWPLRNEYAERFDAAEQPPARARTPTQDRVARCPRCGMKLEKDEG